MKNDLKNGKISKICGMATLRGKAEIKLRLRPQKISPAGEIISYNLCDDCQN